MPRYEDLIGDYDRVLDRFRRFLGGLEPEQEVFPRLYGELTGHLHGIDHWIRVGIHGLAIARFLRGRSRITTILPAQAGELEDAVISAAFFHDCARTSDRAEPEHGREGDRVWRHFAARKGLDRGLLDAVSQALLFHVDHEPVDPAANDVSVCLCNADRLDRVRLRESPDPERMYPDGVWREIAPLAEQLLQEVSRSRVLMDLGWRPR